VLALRRERQKKGWTLGDLAAKTGIHEADLSMIELGRRPAYPGWQKRIAREFRMSRADLFCEVEDDER
jgi:transcriptional regulator with XRE-family HTH domain